MEEPKLITWHDTRIEGSTNVGADVYVEPEDGEATFRIVWIKHGEPGYGEVNGDADTVEEAKAMVEAILAVRKDHTTT